MRAALTGLLADLLDLTLPMTCAACAAPVTRAGPGALGCPVCPPCRAAVDGATAGPVRPVPPPAGLPPCAAWAGYAGTLRDLVLAYKEREAWGLASLLGAGLAAAVRVVSPGPGPLILVPVPATAAAVRARQGDHVLRLARVAATHLGLEGRLIGVRSLVRALPTGLDSTELGAAERARRASSAFAPRAGALSRIRVSRPHPGAGRGGGRGRHRDDRGDAGGGGGGAGRVRGGGGRGGGGGGDAPTAFGYSRVRVLVWGKRRIFGVARSTLWGTTRIRAVSRAADHLGLLRNGG